MIVKIPSTTPWEIEGGKRSKFNHNFYFYKNHLIGQLNYVGSNYNYCTNQQKRDFRQTLFLPALRMTHETGKKLFE